MLIESRASFTLRIVSSVEIICSMRPILRGRPKALLRVHAQTLMFRTANCQTPAQLKVREYARQLASGIIELETNRSFFFTAYVVKP